MNSKHISWQLLKSILGIYIFITAIITTLHIAIAYIDAKNGVKKELVEIGEIFMLPLRSALWELNSGQIDSVGKGIQHMPTVYGVEIVGTKGELLYQSSKKGFTKSESNSFLHSFDVYQEFDGRTIFLAKVNLYSSSDAVFERTKVGFFMLLLSVLIESAALTVLFYLAFQKYLKKPLDLLTAQISAIDENDYTTKKIEVYFGEQNELSMLQDSFNKLLARIIEQEDAKVRFFSQQNKQLELEVQKRTVELQKSELRHRVIFEESGSAGVVWRQDGYIITDWNKKAEEMFGWTKEEVLGKNFFDFMLPEDEIKPIKGKLSQISTSESFRIHSVNKNLTKSGKLLIVEWFNAMLPKIGDETQEVVSLAIDITERRMAEKALEAAKAKAEAATKAKSEFLANMSHEIRTPMNAIVGMAYLLKETELDDKQRNYLRKIEISANSLLGIINDILDFSKIEAGKLELEKVEFDLKEVTRNVLGAIELKAEEKGLKVSVNYASDVNPNLIGDPLRLSQILINLASNAVKFTSSGEIGIYISRVSNDRFRFEVRDTGIGLSKEERQRLFKSFTQADSATTRKYGGTGLGLAICKQLVEMMEGEIWVESEPGVGSRFIFEVKLQERERGSTQNEIEPKPNESLRAELSSISSSRILLADDNEINREILTELLKKSEIEIDPACNGIEAVDKFKAAMGEYDLVLMDIQMPLMDGYEAASIIRKLNSDVPIIALTANALKSDIDKSIEVGMNDHLSKPIEPERLFATLLKYIPKKADTKPLEPLKSENGGINFEHIEIDRVVPKIIEDMEFYAKIARMFIEKYDGIKLAIDDAAIKDTLHSMKGISATVGATRLHSLCLTFEKEPNETTLNDLKEELEFVCKELKDNFS